MKRRAFMGLGAAFIGVGALYSTDAFSTIGAGRGVAVNAVEDHNGALLGIDNIDSTDEPVFANNTILEMEVELTDIDPEATITFDGNSSPYRFPLSPTTTANGNESINIETENTSQSALVAITAELFDGESENGEITMQRDFSVPQSQITDFTGTAKSPGGSGKFEFDLENVGDKRVTLTGIGINATTRSEAAKVADDKNSDDGTSFTGDNQALVTTSIPIDSTDPESDTRLDFETEFELPVDESATFEFDRVRNSNGNQLKMDGENMRITVYFGDNSHKPIDLCLDDATCGNY